MQVSVENSTGLERRLKVAIPGGQVEQEVKARLQRLARTQKIDGFRPGKAPITLIKTRYGNAVLSEVIDETLKQSYFQAIREQNLNPAGYPKFDTVQYQEGKELEYVAIFEVYPEVTVQSLAGVSIEQPIAEVSDQDIDTMLLTLRKQQGSWTKAERAAADGDQVIVDFVGKLDGEVFDGGSATDFPLVIGSKSMIPGFEQGIEGLSAGDQKTIDVSFPEDYQASHLAGKSAQFDISVKQVNERSLPELNDDFASRFGVKEGGIDALRNEVRSNMTRELNQVIKNKVKALVFDALLKANTFDLPAALISNEVGSLREQAIQRFSQGRQLPAAQVPELPDSLFQDEARRRVALGLLLSKLIAEHKLEPEEARLRATLEQLATAYENPAEVIGWYYQDPERLGEIKSLVLEEQLVDLLLTQANVQQVQTSFEAIMNPQAGK